MGLNVIITFPSHEKKLIENTGCSCVGSDTLLLDVPALLLSTSTMLPWPYDAPWANQNMMTRSLNCFFQHVALIHSDITTLQQSPKASRDFYLLPNYTCLTKHWPTQQHVMAQTYRRDTENAWNCQDWLPLTSVMNTQLISTQHQQPMKHKTPQREKACCLWQLVSVKHVYMKGLRQSLVKRVRWLNLTWQKQAFARYLICHLL